MGSKHLRLVEFVPPHDLRTSDEREMERVFGPKLYPTKHYRAEECDCEIGEKHYVPLQDKQEKDR